MAGLVVVCLNAQNLGRVSGIVNDPAVAPVPAANVSLSLPGSAESQFETKTTSAGTFTLAGLRPGEYDPSVVGPGFSKVLMRQIRVGAGLETPIGEIRLEVASVCLRWLKCRPIP